MLNLLGCHDTERVLTRHGGDTDATVLAFALLFAAHGAPMLYYGDEVGMTGENDPGCRGTMEWDRERWAADVYDAVVGLSTARRESVALRRGDQRLVALGPDAVAVVRTVGSEVAVVAVNRGGTRTVDIAAATGVDGLAWEVRYGRGAAFGAGDPGSLSLGPGGVAVVVATDEGAGGRSR